MGSRIGLGGHANLDVITDMPFINELFLDHVVQIFTLQ